MRIAKMEPSERDVQRAMKLIMELGNLLKNIKGGSFPTDLLSTFGELKVFLELRRRFPNSKISFRRKARADISIDMANIEVKTSNLKKEDYGEGFALHIKKCKQHPDASFNHPRRGRIYGDFCYLNYLICVAVNENNLDSPHYYIFSRDELKSIITKIENKSKRFWYAPYRILVPIKPDPKQKGIIYNEFDLELARDGNRFRDKWDKIKIRNSTS
jgi:hypothetical protein